MKINFQSILYLLFLVSFTTCLSDDEDEIFPTENDVAVLDDLNFELALDMFEYVFVKFYAPWCQHSKDMKVDWQNLATQLQYQIPNLKIAQVNCEKDSAEQLCKEHGIQKYPTLMFYKNGKNQTYNNERNYKDLYLYIVKQTGPSYHKITSTKKLESYLSPEQSNILYFGNEQEQEFKIFEEISLEYSDANFLLLDPNLQSYFHVSEKLIMVIGQDIFKFERDYTKQNIQNFMKKQYLDRVLEFNHKMVQKIFDEGFGEQKPMLILIYDQTDSNYQSLVSSLKEIYDEIQKDLWVFATQINHGLGKQFAESQGIKKNNLPILRIIYPENEEDESYAYFQLNQEINQLNIINFVKDFWLKKLQKFTATPLHSVVKSEEIPLVQNNDLYQLVANEFNDIVMEQYRDVLVYIYSPTCQYCREFKPEIVEYARRRKQLSENKLFIASMDWTKNELSTLSVKEYPCIYLFLANQKSKPIKYTYDRLWEDVERFYQENTQFKIEGNQVNKGRYDEEQTNAHQDQDVLDLDKAQDDIENILSNIDNNDISNNNEDVEKNDL